MAVFSLASAEEGLFEAYTETAVATAGGLESFRDCSMRLLRSLRCGEREVDETWSFGCPVEELFRLGYPVQQFDVRAVSEYNQLVAG